MEQSHSKKQISLWALYDFANSLALANVSFYFGLFLVGEQGISDIWVSIPTALSTILLFLTLPILGARSDRSHRRMPFIATFSTIAIVSLLGIGALAIRPNTWHIAIIILLYFLFQYSFQAGLGFYDALLQKLSSHKSKEQVSGLGMAAGQFGNALGILLVFPFVNGMLHIFGVSGRPAAFILGGLLFLVASLPFYLFFKERPAPLEKEAPKTHHHLSTSWQSIKTIIRHPGVLNYLITYYLFSDALLTFQLFATVYLEVVGGLNDTFKTIVAITSLLLAVAGSLLVEQVKKVFGTTRNSIGVMIACWSISIVILAIAAKPLVFIIIGGINGFFFGSLYSLSRAYYSDLAPADRQGEFFGIYTLFERFASVLGPLVWSTTVLVFARFGTVTKYRFAMLSLAVLVAISLVVLHHGKDHTVKKA